MTLPVEQALLAAEEQSPLAAAAHDRAAWVGLFRTDGCIEDPVGSRPHTGAAEIGRFYDTFIGPREISFHRDLDVVRGSSVIRDLDLEAYWELPGVSAVPATLQLSQARLRNQRLRGTAGFRRVGSRHKTLVATLVSAIGRGDIFAAQQTLSFGATIAFGDDDTAGVAAAAFSGFGISRSDDRVCV